MDEQENDNVGLILSLAIGIALMAACGVSGFVLTLLATQIF